VPNIFFNARQEQVFDAVLSGVRHLGYRGALLERNYEFTDWFSSASAPSSIPAAAFGRTPVDYDAACIAIFPAVGDGSPLHYRALGAPF